MIYFVAPHIEEYQLLFEQDNVRLSFSDEAVQYIAKTANEKGTGARGLRAIIEDTLNDIMFDLPEMDGICECRITSDVLLRKQSPYKKAS